MPQPSLLIVADFAAALANTAPWIWRDQADHLPDIAALQRLSGEHGLSATKLGDHDLRRARELRRPLRAPFDAETDRACLEAIDHLLAELQPVPRLACDPTDPSIRWRCPSGLAIDDSVAETTYALARIVTNDGRRRLHHCAAHACHGVFLDTTRNRSRRFCMPELCGNRTNVNAHRQRAKTQ